MITGLILCLTAFAVSVNVLPGLVTGLSEQYSVPIDRFGIAFFIQYLSFFICSTLAGLLVSKGYRKLNRLIITALFTSGVFLALIGVVHTFFSFLMIIFVVGGCGGVVESASSALLSRFEKEGSSRYMNLSQFFYCIGAITAPFITGIFFYRGRGVSFIVLGLGIFIGIISSIILILFSLNRGKFVLDERSGKPEQNGKKTLISEEIPSVSAKAADINSNNAFIWLLLAIFLYVFLESSLASWIPLYSKIYIGVSAGASAIMLTLFWAGVAANRLFFSFYSCGSLSRCILLHIAGIVASIVMLILFRNRVFLPVGMVFLGAFCGSVWPMLVSLCQHLYRKEYRVMYMVSSGSLGAFIGPIATSFIFSRTGIEDYFIITGIYAGILLLLSLKILPKNTKVSNILRQQPPL